MMREFRVQPRPARPDLGDPRLGVNAPLASWLPFEVLHDIGHIDAIAGDADRFERAIEHSARGTDKGLSGNVLCIPRLLTHEHHGCIGTALSEDGLRRATPEIASLAVGCREPGACEASGFGGTNGS